MQMDIHDIRRENARRLAKQSGSQSAFIKKTNKPQTLISRSIGKNPTKQIGGNFARDIESSFNKAHGWLDQIHDNTEQGPSTKGLIPLISWVQAGNWHMAEDHYVPGDAEDFYPCPISHGPHTYCLRVRGDSMTSPYGRSYPDGALIYVDPDQRGGITTGDRVIAKVCGEDLVTFKAFVEDAGNRFLKPLNPQYPIVSSDFRILGKVIGMWMD